MDDLTQRILAHDADVVAHPDDYRIQLRCHTCGKLYRYFALPKEEVVKARLTKGLPEAALVVIGGYCPQHDPGSSDTDDEDDA